jgi:hypothetical protein
VLMLEDAEEDVSSLAARAAAPHHLKERTAWRATAR